MSSLEADGGRRVRCRRPDVCCKAAAVDAQKKRKHILCTLQCEIIFCVVICSGLEYTSNSFDAAKDKSQIKI